MGEERHEQALDEELTGTAGTALEGSNAGTADEIVGTPGWAATSGAAELERERTAKGGASDPGAGGDAGPGGTPPYGSSGQEGQGAEGTEPPGG